MFEIIKAGTFQLDGETVTGFFVEVPKEELEKIPFNPFGKYMVLEEKEKKGEMNARQPD